MVSAPAALPPRGFQRALARADQVLQLLLDHIDQGAGLRALLGRQLAQAFQQRGDLAFLAQVIDTQLFQRGAVFGRCDRSLRLIGEWFEVFHSLLEIDFSCSSSLTNIKRKGKSEPFPFLYYM